MFKKIKASIKFKLLSLFKVFTNDAILSLTNKKGQPNINPLWALTKDIEAIRLNLKYFGYDIGHKLQNLLPDIDISDEPKYYGIISKPTTQNDIESSWFSYWCKELESAPIYHRKLWEYAFILQALFENNMLLQGKKCIGFGCGREPLASYFASKKINVIVSDLDPERVADKGWAKTNQHTTVKSSAFHPNLISREIFDDYVDHEYIDMNNLPSFENKFDYCWSVCALEHLGSIQNGLDFVCNSLDVLKPGGIAVHTTEYNYLHNNKTIDNWDTVLFLRKHFEDLAEQLANKGHELIGPDFDIGNGILDRFIDLPPYQGDTDSLFGRGFSVNPLDSMNGNKGPIQLKLNIDGFPSTCFGLLIRKSS